MIDKAPDAYRTISEVADELDLPQHVLRFWETRFGQIKPLKRGGGRRYYRPDDVELLSGIRHLLYSEGYTIKGVQRILKEQGPRAVQAFARPMVGEEPPVAPPHAAPAPRTAPPMAVAPVYEDHFEDIGQNDPEAYEAEPYEPDVYMPPPPPPRPVVEPVAARPAAPPVLPPVVPVAPRAAPVQEVMPAPMPAVQPAAPPAPAPAHSPQPYLAPLAPAFPPERPYTLPAGTEQRSGTPVYMPEPDMAAHEPPPRPAPPANPTVSYMRGGLSRPVVPAPQPPPVPVAPVLPEEEPAPSQGFSVRRAVRPANPVPPAPEQAPQRYSPLVEPDLAEAMELAPVAPPPRAGLSDEARRSLQSALFELSECRRAIEITIAARDR